jgi:Arc/MetJ-type ribon-helix-helix transcriptional regulator
MPNVTISLNKDILKVIDDLCKEGKYVSRYDFVKSAVEEKEQKERKEEKKLDERGKESERQDSGTDGKVRNDFEDID